MNCFSPLNPFKKNLPTSAFDLTTDHLSYQMQSLNRERGPAPNLTQQVGRRNVNRDRSSAKPYTYVSMFPSIVFNLLTTFMQNALHKVVPTFLATKGKPRLSWPTPDQLQASLFNNGEPSTEIPSEKEPKIDWFYKGKTPWTKAIAEYFVAHFVKLYNDGAFPLLRPPPSKEDIGFAFEEYITYLKKLYIRELANPEKAAAQKAKEEQRSRRNNRVEQVSLNVM
jgi:hypothetical protein